MKETEILQKTVTYFKKHGNTEAQVIDIFDLQLGDPLVKSIEAILCKYPFMGILQPMGPLRMAFLIKPEYYTPLIQKTPEDFLEYYYEKAREHNERVQMLREKEKKEHQMLDLTIEDLVNKVVDNPKVNGRLKRAELIAGLSALAAIIAAIASLKGC